MRVYFSIFLLWLVASTRAAATPVTLTMSNGILPANGTVSFSLMLATTGTPLPTALQWAMAYDVLDVTSITVLAAASAVNAGKLVQCNSGAGSLACLVFGMNSTTIADGVLASVSVTAAKTPLHATTTIALSGGMAVDLNGYSIPTITNSGTLTVTTSQTDESTSLAYIGIGMVGLSTAALRKRLLRRFKARRG